MQKLSISEELYEEFQKVRIDLATRLHYIPAIEETVKRMVEVYFNYRKDAGERLKDE